MKEEREHKKEEQKKIGEMRKPTTHPYQQGF